jgi:hypothetical protein
MTLMKKQGVGGIPSYRPILPLPFSVHSSKFRIPQVLYLPLLRKHPGCVPTIPILELISHRECSERSNLQNVQRANGFLSIPILFTLLRTFWQDQKLNSFIFRRLRTLCKKPPGVGYPCRSYLSRAGALRTGPGRVYSRSTFNFRLSTFSVRLLHGPRIPGHGSRWEFRGKEAPC